MKKHLSILMLAARQSLYKLLALYILMAAAQVGLFLMALRAGGSPGFERLVTNSRMGWVFAAAFLLTAALLCAQNSELAGSKCGYTLRRLRVTERTAVLWQAGYNCLALLLLWAAELAAVFLAARLYAALAAPELQSPQTLFLAFYRHRLLHGLLPLADWTRLARDIALLLALSLSFAVFPYKLRRGARDAMPAALVMLTVVFFPGNLANLMADVLIIVLALADAGFCLRDLWKEDGDEEAA